MRKLLEIAILPVKVVGVVLCILLAPFRAAHSVQITWHGFLSCIAWLIRWPIPLSFPSRAKAKPKSVHTRSYGVSWIGDIARGIATPFRFAQSVHITWHGLLTGMAALILCPIRLVMPSRVKSKANVTCSERVHPGWIGRMARGVVAPFRFAQAIPITWKDASSAFGWVLWPVRKPLGLSVRRLGVAGTLCAILAAGSAVILARDIYSGIPKETVVPHDLPGFFIGRHPSSSDAAPIYYGLYLPPHFRDEEGPFPLIVFLHGYGERKKEDILERGLTGGIRSMVNDGKRFEFAALFPIDSKGRWEPGSVGVTNTFEVLDHVIKRHRIDPTRVYLSGHSAGGAGVWRLAEGYPERWAAVVPVCAVRFPDVQRVKDIPCWIFQGEADEKVSVHRVRKLVSDLKAANTEVLYTEYPKAGHTIWPMVFNTPDLYEWLATKKLAARKK